MMKKIALKIVQYLDGDVLKFYYGTFNSGGELVLDGKIIKSFGKFFQKSVQCK